MIPKPSSTQPKFSGNGASHTQDGDDSNLGQSVGFVEAKSNLTNGGGNMNSTKGVETPSDGGGNI